ncbi:MAG: ABC transporter permease subunit, partial [Microbacteriaceae bacterium]
MLFLLLLVFQGAPFWAVVAALTIYNGTLIGEILRAGLRSLPRGQREAGLTIGLSGTRTRFLIEFPQAFKQMTPIIVAQIVVLLKDTSLGYVISYPELLRNNMSYLAAYYGNNYMFTFFFITLAIYLLINLTVSWFAKYLSRRMTHEQRPAQGGAGGPEAPDLPGMEPLPPITSVITAHTGR